MCKIMQALSKISKLIAWQMLDPLAHYIPNELTSTFGLSHNDIRLKCGKVFKNIVNYLH